jgi:hypothetical protein
VITDSDLADVHWEIIIDNVATKHLWALQEVNEPFIVGLKDVAFVIERGRNHSRRTEIYG